MRLHKFLAAPVGGIVVDTTEEILQNVLSHDDTSDRDDESDDDDDLMTPAEFLRYHSPRGREERRNAAMGRAESRSPKPPTDDDKPTMASLTNKYRKSGMSPAAADLKARRLLALLP